jgi:hypothetical protein
MMKGRTGAIPLVGAKLGKQRHICAFFHSRDEEYQVLLPFMREGIEGGEKAFYIIDPRRRAEHAGRLEESRINVEAAVRSGQLEVRGWDEAYLRGGRFNQGAMLTLIEEVLRGGKAQGFPRTRLVANMEWALEDLPGVDGIVEYETRLNYVLSKYDDPVV